MKKDKKGILLLTTLFFVVVLIMMSVALFGLTRNNFQVNKDFFANQRADINGENAIQILLFWIQHQPTNFKLGNNNVILLNLDPNLPMKKILDNQNYNNALPYFYVIWDMQNRANVANNLPQFNVAISQDEPTQSAMYSVILWPKDRNISEEGVVFFWGNATESNNVRSPQEANLVYYQILDRNSVQFWINQNPTGSNVWPIYTSVNNGNSEVQVNKTSPSTSRRIAKDNLVLFALTYSLVPGTNRYKVKYIEQGFTKTSLLRGSAYVNGNTDIRVEEKL
ncbi:MAG: hypothetical protein ACK4GR_05870, partial [bacterium]